MSSRHVSYVLATRTCVVALPIYVVGLVLSGIGFQRKLSVAVVVIGWGTREVAVMINTVAVCAYPHLLAIVRD